ncbi:MAG: prepilin-type N-terminal cleavage/methylation domain-containing protein [Candidatus Omnitrophota bacterium]
MMKNGFTLLELIVVIIIISVMASLGLPKLVDMVKSSYAPEAMQSFSVIKDAIDRCLLMSGIGDSSVDCDALAVSQCIAYEGVLDVDDPFNDPRSHFMKTGWDTHCGVESYCYQIGATLKESLDDYSDYIIYQFCSNTEEGLTFCTGDICTEAAAGVTIVGAGAFKWIRIGPGVTDASPSVIDNPPPLPPNPIPEP